MPYISTTTNIKVDKQKETELKASFGKAISLIPGKSENWLMVSISDETPMYFKGNGDSPIAFVEVSIFGGASDSAYDAMTAELTKQINTILGIEPQNIYIKYEESTHWGWAGSNF